MLTSTLRALEVVNIFFRATGSRIGKLLSLAGEKRTKVGVANKDGLLDPLSSTGEVVLLGLEHKVKEALDLTGPATLFESPPLSKYGLQQKESYLAIYEI